MKSQTTAIWFMLAALLFAAIWFGEKQLAPPASAPGILLSGLRVGEVTGLQISPAGAHEISVVRTNGGWQLEKPLAYPAQAAGIENLLGALAKLVPALRLTGGDVRGKNSDTEFGFDNPQATLDLAAGEQTWHLRVGNKTAPGDQVYIRVVGLMARSSPMQNGCNCCRVQRTTGATRRSWTRRQPWIGSSLPTARKSSNCAATPQIICGA